MRAQLAALQAQQSSLVIKHGFLIGIYSGAAAAGSSAAAFGEELFEADGDGVALVRRQLQMPPFPGAEAMSKVDALSMYAGTVRELSLQLHIFRACQAEEHALVGNSPAGISSSQLAGNSPAGISSSQLEAWSQKPLQRMKDALNKHLWWLMTLSKCGRSNMAFDLVVTDFETGNTLPAPPLELHRFATQQIQFSQQQKERLAAIHAVYQEFMQRLGAQEVPQLNLGADNPQQHGSTGSSSSSSNGADGSSSGSSSIPGLQSLSRLQQNLQLWAGVNRLQRKELLVRGVATAFVVANLTTVQLAELMVYCSPCAATALLISAIVAEDVQAERQQQQQQQLAALHHKGQHRSASKRTA
ncbi:hypothetical protein OEZ85_002653 [Tetradesmus obliquus]|uniref:Uncharacterized protein n=1 Tax=Tetradesmus obliquus TaxID=3088 RepID=A0ABY8TY83_TETOB|nr:hypothetical protein OEZ85_002653 [Tetradesmus obliquus]